MITIPIRRLAATALATIAIVSVAACTPAKVTTTPSLPSLPSLPSGADPSAGTQLVVPPYWPVANPSMGSPPVVSPGTPSVWCREPSAGN